MTKAGIVKPHIQTLKKEIKDLPNIFQLKMNITDFANVTSYFK